MTIPSAASGGNDPDEACRLEACRCGVGYADVERIAIDLPTFRSIPVVLQTQYEALPVKRDGETLYVAVAEVSGRTRERLGSFTGLRIVQVLAVAEKIARKRQATASDAVAIPGSRRIVREVRMYADPQRAEDDLEAHYGAMTPEERMQEMSALLRRWGGWDERRLERVARFVNVE